MIDLDGEPHIMDFGLAKREAGEITMTMEGRVIGTPAFMSPEQARGEGHHADRRSDVYSMGVVLFQLLTGELPFRGNPRMLIVQILKDDPPSPRKLNGGIARDLETICLKCLEKEPAGRYATAEQLAGDLHHYLNGEPVTARPSSMLERGWRWVRRHPAPAGLVAASGAVLISVAGLLVSYGYQQRLESAYSQLELTNDELADSKNTLDRALYFQRISGALSAWHENKVSRAERLLHDCPTDWRHWEWYYVNSLFHSGVTTLEGHTGWVTSVAFGPDGKRIASASTEVKIWDADSHRELHTLNGASGQLAFSPDGTWVLGEGDGYTLKVWNAESGREVRILGTHLAGIGDIAFSPDGQHVATSSSDGSVRVWEAESGREVHVFEGHRGFVHSVAFSSDGRQIAAKVADMVKVWDTATGNEIRTVAEGVVAFSPEGERLVTKSSDGTVIFRDAKTGHEVRTFRSSFNGLAFSPNGKRIVESSRRLVKIVDAETGEELMTLKGHTDTVQSAVFSTGGNRVASGSRDQTVKVWMLDGNREARTLSGHADEVWSVDVSPDGMRIVSGSRDNSLKVWSLASGQQLLELEGHTNAIWTVAFGPDGKRIVSNGADNTIRVWDTESVQELLAIKTQGSNETSRRGPHRNGTVAFSPDGQTVVGANGGDTVKVWDIVSGEEMLTLNGHTTPVFGVALSPRGNRIASGAQKLSEPGSPLKIWDTESGAEVYTLDGHRHNIVSVTFSSDGKRVATGSYDNTIKVWDADTGEEKLTLYADSFVNCVAFSPDSKRILGATRAGTIRIWESESGQEAGTLVGHSGSVESVVFTPDGRRIVSGSRDGTIKIWDAGTTEFVQQLRPPNELDLIGR